MKRALSRGETRLALAAAHGLAPGGRPRGRRGVLEVFERHRVVQSDPIEAAGRNQDLTLQSRVDGYRQAHLHDLLYRDRKLFEYYCKMASIMPMATYPVFGEGRARMREKNAPFFKQHPEEAREVLEALEAGPVSSRDFCGGEKVRWWGLTKVCRVVLEKLFVDGETVIHHRDGGVKYYAMADKVLPRSLVSAEGPSGDDYRKAIALMICRASRLVSPSRAPEQWWEVGKTKKVAELLGELERDGELFALEAEGWKGKLYAPTEDERIWAEPDMPEGECVRFLAPLDPLLWNRGLFAEIYGHRYCWEIYKVPEDRRYGYYSLPVLLNGDFAGLVEPWFDKKEKVLEIRSFHLLGSEIDRRRLRVAVDEALERFAAYLGAERVRANKVKL